MASTKRHWAKRPFGYAGEQLERGQIVQLVGARNDEKLVRLNYLGEVERGTEIYECGTCGRAFIGMAERAAHGQDAHRPVALTPQEEDARDERRERLLAEIAPVGRGIAQ